MTIGGKIRKQELEKRKTRGKKEVETRKWNEISLSRMLGRTSLGDSLSLSFFGFFGAWCTRSPVSREHLVDVENSRSNGYIIYLWPE